MNNTALIRFVVQHLEAGVLAIPHERISALQRARELALSRQKVSGEGKSSRRIAYLAKVRLPLQADFFLPQALARFAVLLLISGVVAFWHAQSYVVETADLDFAILADEMPIDVITDKGFNEWLEVTADG